MARCVFKYMDNLYSFISVEWLDERIFEKAVEGTDAAHHLLQELRQIVRKL
jgi:hypothetical protein